MHKYPGFWWWFIFIIRRTRQVSNPRSLFGIQGVYHTIDGGVYWEMSSLAYKVDFHDVQFLDLNHGWLAGDQGIVLYTRMVAQTGSLPGTRTP